MVFKTVTLRNYRCTGGRDGEQTAKRYFPTLKNDTVNRHDLEQNIQRSITQPHIPAAHRARRGAGADPDHFWCLRIAPRRSTARPKHKRKTYTQSNLKHKPATTNETIVLHHREGTHMTPLCSHLYDGCETNTRITLGEDQNSRWAA